MPLLFFTHPPPLFKSDTLDFEANKYLSNVSRREVNEGKLGRSGKQRGAKGRERERKKKYKVSAHTERKRGGVEDGKDSGTRVVY